MLQNIGNVSKFQEPYQRVHCKMLDKIPKGCTVRDEININHIVDITFFLINNILYLCGTSKEQGKEIDNFIFSKVTKFTILGDVVKGSELSYIEGSFMPMFRYIQSYSNSATLYGYEDDSVYFCMFHYGTMKTYVKYMCSVASIPSMITAKSNYYRKYNTANDIHNLRGNEKLAFSDSELMYAKTTCILFNPHFRFDYLGKYIKSRELIDIILMPVGVIWISQDIYKLPSKGGLYIFFPHMCEDAFEFPVADTFPDDWFGEDSVDIVACGFRKSHRYSNYTPGDCYSEIITMHARILDKIYDLHLFTHFSRGQKQVSFSYFEHDKNHCKCVPLNDYILSENKELSWVTLKQKSFCERPASRYLNQISSTPRALLVDQNGEILHTTDMYPQKKSARSVIR